MKLIPFHARICRARYSRVANDVGMNALGYLMLRDEAIASAHFGQNSDPDCTFALHLVQAYVRWMQGLEILLY